MFYIGLKGGLGNQFFQYALFYELKKKYDVELDVTWFVDRGKEVALTKIVKNISFTKKKLCRIADVNVTLFSRIKKHFFKKKTHIIENQKELFDFTKLNNDVDYYLDGYWQSYKYFEKSIPEIRDLFAPELEIKKCNIFIKQKFNDKRLCSVHVRRGDYIKDKIMNCLDISYYKNAIQKYLELYPNSEIIIVSDDIPFCKSNFCDIPQVSFCDWNKSALQDLYTMAVCEDHILSNSTFSYWGALLSRHEGNVYFPSKWFSFADSKDVSFMFPEGWICIE